MNRKIITSCLVFLLVICLVLSVVAVVAAGITFWGPGISDLLQGAEDQDASTPAETSIPSGDSEVITELSPSILAEMETIQRQVAQERGLDPSGTFTRILWTPDQLRQHVLDEFLKDYSQEDMVTDGIVLQAFGLLNADFDLYHFYLDLLSENIAGFYDNETQDMVVVQGGDFGGIERLTYAHEYTHALQDQNYGIKDGLGYGEEACETDSERCAAVQALLEGDATLSELRWFMNHATSADRSDVFDFSDSFESPILDSAPAFIAKDFIFPYEDGFEFVQFLYDRGGWEAVDDAFANPPVSTEQILHPERYPQDLPVTLDLPDLLPVLGPDWDMLDQDVMGEWYTYLILSQGYDEDARVKEKVAAQATEGWGGDAYQVYYHPDDDAVLLVFRIQWESTQDADEFKDAFIDYARDRFGKPLDKWLDLIVWQTVEEYITFHIDNETTTWIMAPNSETSEMVWSLISSD